MTGPGKRLREGDGLAIGGTIPLSSVDYPGALAAVVFCRGCPWHCPYCHNAALRDAVAGPAEGEEDFPNFLKWLESRRGLLDAVVFSGGEPTLQPALPEAMRAVTAMGFRVGLHTTGMVPEAFSAVLPQCDWVGLDIKAPPEAYDRITERPDSGAAAFASLTLLQQSGVPFEVRTTWHPALLEETEMQALAKTLAQRGVEHWVLQAVQLQSAALQERFSSQQTIISDAHIERLRTAAPQLDIQLRK